MKVTEGCFTWGEARRMGMTKKEWTEREDAFRIWCEKFEAILSGGRNER